MSTLNDRLSQEMSDWEQMTRLRRIQERNDRKKQRKEDNHWNFLAGALVAKYLKEDLKIPVYKGKDSAAKNASSFAPLENILVYLATHKNFTAQIALQPREPPSLDP